MEKSKHESVKASISLEKFLDMPFIRCFPLKIRLAFLIYLLQDEEEKV